MLTAEAIRKIPDKGKIVVSIDHPHADKYEQIRVGGDLNMIVSNLKRLKKIKPHQWMCIQAVIMNSNIDYLEDFIRLAKDTSADAIKFIHPMIFSSEMRYIHLEDSEEVKLKMDKARAYAKRLKIRFVAVPAMRKPRVCVEPWSGLRVSAKGDIYPCCYINNSNEFSWCEWYKNTSLYIPQSNYVMSNVHDKSISDMWNGGIFRALRKEIVDTRQAVLMPADRLSALRGKIDISHGFSYCSVCLYRQNKAC